MKYFQNLLLLGIFLTTILFGQSIEIPHKMMNQNTTLNIPIFIYNVTNLESIHLKIEYDESIILAEEIIENPVGILDGGYTFTTNLTELGIIEIAIGSTSTNVFSGSGRIAQITFNSIGELGEFSALTFLDAQINSNWQVPRVHGSIEIILDKLTITGQDNSGIGADDSIILGMCEGCTDGWKYGEDEYDNPNPPNDYTDIYIFHPDWLLLTDSNGNTNLEENFATDYRQQHSSNQLISWGISGSTGGDIPLDIPITLSWDSNKLNSTSSNSQMFIYIGETGYDMQQMDNIIISQSELTLNEINEPNIWVMLGECADIGETITYYQDSDGDGLGGSVEREFCEGLQPEGWVGTNDEDMCDGFVDCNDACNGIAEIDNCDICDNNNSNNCVQDCSGEWGGVAVFDNCNICDDISSNDCKQDCNDIWGGTAYLDNCLICVESQSDECIQDCSGVWGGDLNNDDCGICGGNENDGDTNGDGDDCDNIICSSGNEHDCNGDCEGLAIEDECGICDNDSSNDCVQDCNEVWGGYSEIDNCGICDNDASNDCVLDCSGEWGGAAVFDNCDICDNNNSNNCVQDCSGEWGDVAVFDNCGICDNDASNDCVLDCNNEWGGSATMDVNCNVCIGGTTGLEACSLDCNGVWGGYAFTDECGVCDSDNTNNNQCADCAGEIYGEAIVDNCNECILAGEISPCVQGCDEIWNNNGFEVKYDECGVCGGDNLLCTDCFGEVNGEAWMNACGICVPLSDTSCSIDCAETPNGDAVKDNCGNCDTDTSNDCILDCYGDWGGEATIDEHCGTCIGGQTELEPCSLDCNGIWGGNSKNDLCGICDADSENDNYCVDCNGMVDGLAKLDDCLNCVEDLSDSSYECEQDCEGVWDGNYPPTSTCQNGDIVCNLDACFNLANEDFLLPQKFDISRIYPNPFNPSATIDFEVSEPTMVQLNIYNLKGQKVEMLKDAYTLPGHYSVIWNGTNHPSGIYFVILHSSNSIIKQKMMLIK